ITTKHNKKLVIVGDDSIGKTSLLWVYVRKQFPTDWIPTVFESYIATIILDTDNFVELAFWDTAGQRQYDRLRPLSYHYVDVFLLCFAVEQPDSLKNIEEKWANEVRHFCPKVPIILVANKTDLRDDDQIIFNLNESNQEPIQTKQGQEMAQKIGAFTYLECSAKLNEGVKEVFDTAARASLQSIKKRGCVLL
ncbi:ras-like GTP-binding protein RHO, partial [Clytia hemisphaerica]|uniref:ras-like GTP-binding protein RHO n=1 Tax=Clytia hemisphaerica TaxID=252671 RepID=UPI0034D6879B